MNSKTIGIIAEYNPLHKGHAWQLEFIKNKLKADTIIVLISGNFNQRGIPAIIDKYERTRLALLNHADLVIELPVCAATSSAEIFAHTGVGILNALGIVDTLAFGAEYPHIEFFSHLANLLINESSEYSRLLNKNLKIGMSFPAARASAIENIIENKDYINYLLTPNNILGIEYIKAIYNLKSKMDFYPIKRQGDFLSSTKIREIIRKNELTSLKELIPIDSYNTISQKSNENKLLSIEDFSLPLHYALLNSKELNIYLDGNEDLANRTGKLLGEYIDIYDFAKNKLKSKNYTLTHIMRYLLHILLNITKTDLDLLKKNYAPYAHILGVRKNRKDLLSKIQENTSIPIFASYKEAVNSLNGEKLKLYERDLFADTVYNAVLTNKSKTRIKDERSRKLLVI